MNGIAHLLEEIDPILVADHPENIQLWLPSELPPSVRDTWCAPDLPRLEYCLRHAMAVNALQNIRRFRRYSQAIAVKTQAHISNTQKTLRGRSQFDRVQRRLDQAVAAYRASWSAIGKLAPNEEFGPWKNYFRELLQEDIRGPGLGSTKNSQSRYIPSWIWQSTPAESSESGINQDVYASLRLEWCQAQARVTWYEEEVQLVVEEMRRTLAYFEWLACQWENRATSPSVCAAGGDNVTIGGISAYARKQAAIYRKLVGIFIESWYECLQEKSLGKSWLCRYRPPPPTKRGVLTSNVRRYHSTSVPPTDLPDDVEVGDDSDAKPSVLDDDDFTEGFLDD